MISNQIAPDARGPRQKQVRSSPRALRVGLLLDTMTQPAWVERVVRQIQTSRIARIVLVVTARRTGTSSDEWAWPVPRTLYDAYERFDTYWFRDDRADPLAEMDVSRPLEGIPHLHASLGGSGGPLRLSMQALRQISDHDLDVALRFGFPDLSGTPLNVARHGVWSYRHGDDVENRGGPPGFWEVMDGNPVTGSLLQIDGGTPGQGKVIYRSYASTSQISLWKNRREYHWKSAAFAMRKLRELWEIGPSAIAQPLPGASPEPARSAAPPTNRQLVRVLPRVVGRYLNTQITRRTSFDQWFIAYAMAGETPAEDGVPDRALSRFSRLVPPRDRLWADPFPVYEKGRHFIMIEELLFARNRGHISVVEVDDRGAASRPEMVLENDNHLSYPYVFRWKGELFMIPESARAGDSPADVGSTSAPIYRAASFPQDWRVEGSILEGVEVFDPTMVEIEGRWWLFCTQAEPGASTWDELHLYYASTPLGPWRPHRRNPVKSDVRSSRPAGRPFRTGGEWFRPAQDCSVRYGYALSINRILRLSTSDYAETEVSRILPSWVPRLIGTHTLNAAGRLSVADGQLRRPRWSPDAAPLPTRELVPG